MRVCTKISLEVTEIHFLWPKIGSLGSLGGPFHPQCGTVAAWWRVEADSGAGDAFTDHDTGPACILDHRDLYYLLIHCRDGKKSNWHESTSSCPHTLNTMSAVSTSQGLARTIQMGLSKLFTVEGERLCFLFFFVKRFGKICHRAETFTLVQFNRCHVALSSNKWSNSTHIVTCRMRQ